MASPERHRTLAEVCELYFPGVTPCALRWMIKRKGYAHSRWGREYRLTDSQVAAIQQDLARPASPSARQASRWRDTGARKQQRKIAEPAENDMSPTPRRRKAGPAGDPKRLLAEQLSSLQPVTPGGTR